ncbi:glycosyltransferase family 4 protein [Salimicrobium halophilum]|uniref:Uncharacterized protein n=1 Tax=Salimicrobium halophilum TaxID=86666 RepID=A0A1G8SER4_9BACI|nr:glycosyltransferase family 4 protein [Salimicrobium halophilum]SDJ27691.1 hypothetical protein SAMN04490247_1419 [Salimicrobium halophilum]
MKIAQVISGAETGGSKNHVLSLLEQFPREEMLLICMQKGDLYYAASRRDIDVRLLEQKSRYDMTAAKRLVELLKEEEVNIVHSHGPRANLFAATAKKKFNKPLVTTMHSDPTLDFMGGGVKGKVFTKLNLWAYKRMDHFFAVSERFKQQLIDLNIHAIDITTIYNGIDFEPTGKTRTLTRSDLGLTEHDLVLAMVARLHPVKGHQYAFEALKNHPDIHLLVVGSGPYESEIREQAKGMPNVHFLGRRSDVDEIYQISDVGLLTSVSESFPLALLEAAKEKRPVITSDVGGVRELVPNEEYGWVVPIKDPDSLEEVLQEAVTCKNTGALRQKGYNLYKRASEHFSSENMAKSYKNVYSRLL